VEKILVGVIGGYRFAQLLQGPGGRAVIGDEFSSTDLHHDKHVETSKGCSDDCQEITCYDGARMIMDKRQPALVASGLTQWGLGHVLPHRAGRDLDPEFQQEFIRNAFLTPTHIIPRHLTNERAKLCWDPRASATALPPPEQPKPGAVPTNQRLRRDIHQGIPPGKKPREKYQ